MSGEEDDSSPPSKKRTVHLMRTPSSSTIAAQNFHTKPSTTPRPVGNVSKSITPVSSEEMKIAIDVLHSFGSDLPPPPPQEDITDENTSLMPIGHVVVQQVAETPNTKAAI